MGDLVTLGHWEEEPNQGIQPQFQAVMRTCSPRNIRHGKISWIYISAPKNSTNNAHYTKYLKLRQNSVNTQIQGIHLFYTIQQEYTLGRVANSNI